MKTSGKVFTVFFCVSMVLTTFALSAQAESSIPACEDHAGKAACDGKLTVVNGFAAPPIGTESPAVPGPATTSAPTPSAPMSGSSTSPPLSMNTGDTNPVVAGRDLPITAYVYSRCTVSCGQILVKSFIKTPWGATLQLNHAALPHAASQEANFVISGNVVRWWNQATNTPYVFGYWFEATQLQAGVPVPARGPATPPLAYDRVVYNKLETRVVDQNGAPLHGLEYEISVVQGATITPILSGYTQEDGWLTSSLAVVEDAIDSARLANGGYVNFFLDIWGQLDNGQVYQSVNMFNANFGATEQETLTPGLSHPTTTRASACAPQSAGTAQSCPIPEPEACDLGESTTQVQDARQQLGPLQVPWNSTGYVEYGESAYSESQFAVNLSSDEQIPFEFKWGTVSANDTDFVVRTNTNNADFMAPYNPSVSTLTYYWDSYWEQYRRLKKRIITPWMSPPLCLYSTTYYTGNWKPQSSVSDPRPTYTARGFQVQCFTWGCDQYSDSSRNPEGWGIWNDNLDALGTNAMALHYLDNRLYERKTTKATGSESGTCLAVGCAYNRSGFNTTHKASIKFGSSCNFWRVYATGFKGTSTGNSVSEWPFYRVDAGQPGNASSGGVPAGCTQGNGPTQS